MTLEEAIEGNEVLREHLVATNLHITAEYVGLGIEALKRERLWQESVPHFAGVLLPGETKE